VVLAVRKGEGCPASHADVRVGPFWWLQNSSDQFQITSIK
jgi:hypothetical protein